MEETMIQIGSRIKKRRKELGMTQPDVYQKCGIDSGSLSKIESGIRTPSVILFYKIAQVLECDIEWLITGESIHTHTPILCQKEEILLKSFRELSPNDQDEIQHFIEYKLYTAQGKNIEKSSPLTNNDSRPINAS